MNVRRARLRDAAAIARIQVDTWRSIKCGIVPDKRLDGMSYERSQRNWEEHISDPNGRKLCSWLRTSARDRGTYRGYRIGPKTGVSDNQFKRFYEAIGGTRVRTREVAVGDKALPELGYGWYGLDALIARLASWRAGLMRCDADGLASETLRRACHARQEGVAPAIPFAAE